MIGGNGNEWPDAFQALFDLGNGQKIGILPGFSITGRHVFDIPNRQRKMECETGEGFDFVIIKSFDGDHVDFDREEDHFSLFYPGPYPFKLIFSSDLTESFFIRESRLILILFPACLRSWASSFRRIPFVVA
jgi:hypothetical protein